LFNVAGTHAIDDTCTHEGAPSGEGIVTGEAVSCPWHGAEFNVTTGEILGPPAADELRTFPIKVQGNDVLVELN
jgi:nitrite reductase/ring-hydroxylating ferredoxin subunit